MGLFIYTDSRSILQEGVPLDLRETLESGFRHPWELSRVDCALNAIKPYVNSEKRIADIGCGDLYFSGKAKSSFKCEVIAVDSGFSEEAASHGEIILYNSTDRLLDKSVDLAILMDVLEHVQDDVSFLENVKSKMRAGGRVLITVPAYQHLFSEHDVFLKHYRRYNRKTLAKALSSAGYTIEKMHYFYSSLYILRLMQLALSKLRKRNSDMVGNATAWERPDVSPVTRLIRGVLNFDYSLNKVLNRLSPFGLSLCAFCTIKE